MDCNPLFWQFSCFIFPPQEWNEMYLLVKLIFAGFPSQAVEDFMELSCPFQNLFFIILFPKLHCPEIALYINVNHAYVLRVSQGTKLPLQTQCRRTTVSLHLLSTNLAGCGRRRWHSCSFLDSRAFQLRWQPINLSARNSRSKEYFRVSGISTILETVPNSDWGETCVFHSPFPSSVTSAGPQGDPTWGPASVPPEDKNISLVIPGGQDAFPNSERLGRYKL